MNHNDTGMLPLFDLVFALKIKAAQMQKQIPLNNEIKQKSFPPHVWRTTQSDFKKNQAGGTEKILNLALINEREI